jgi:SAM-dependent methyltransferase
VSDSCAAPNPVVYGSYLAAKKGLDDRSLNRLVWERLVQAVGDRGDAVPLRVLEVGCGIGTMLERLLDWGLLTRAEYTGIDVEAEFIREAGRRFYAYAKGKHAELKPPASNPLPPGEGEAKEPAQHGTPLVLRIADKDVRVNFEVADLLDFLDREQGKSTWDLLVAHAVLDLIDLPTALPRLLALSAPGGLFYFTLNFDGATIFEPIIDPDLDHQIESLYHQTMDARHFRGKAPGSSTTGRELIMSLKALGARLLTAGSSDWVVFPGPDGYPQEEAYFLHCIIDTIGRALAGHPGLERRGFEEWLSWRHQQIDAAELIYISHQLDVIGYTESSGQRSVWRGKT